jgi:hypothetical protein
MALGLVALVSRARSSSDHRVPTSPNRNTTQRRGHCPSRGYVTIAAPACVLPVGLGVGEPLPALDVTRV